MIDRPSQTGLTPAPAKTARRYRTAAEFATERGAEWAELRRRLRQLKNKPVSVQGATEVQRFADLYRSVSADLAVCQLRFPRSPILVELNELAAQAHNVLYAEERNFWRRFARFFWGGFPIVTRKNARFVFIGAGVLVGAALLGWLWFALAPNSATDAFGLSSGTFNKARVPLTTPAEGVLSSVQIALNNIKVAFFAFAFGVLGCLGTVFLLAYNGLLLGVLGAQAFHVGSGTDFVALVTPHGVLELTVIVLSGAAGMRIGWAVIAPGRRKRSLAVAAAGRDAVRILVGTIPLFVVAALIEGFVTPRGFPVPVNVAIGWTIGVAAWLYLALAGRGRSGAEPSLSAE